MSTEVVKPWMCEMRSDIRASGAGEVASTFHVTRTNLSLSLGLHPLPVLEAESKEAHLSTDRSNLYHGWKIGVESVSGAGKGRRGTIEASGFAIERISFLCLAICRNPLILTRMGGR